MLTIDLTGKRALIAGVSDDGGFGFAIAKALAEAGASVCVGSWPPALGIFTKLLERGKMDESMAAPGAALGRAARGRSHRRKGHREARCPRVRWDAVTRPIRTARSDASAHPRAARTA